MKLINYGAFAFNPAYVSNVEISDDTEITIRGLNGEILGTIGVCEEDIQEFFDNIVYEIDKGNEVLQSKKEKGKDN